MAEDPLDDVRRALIRARPAVQRITRHGFHRGRDLERDLDVRIANRWMVRDAPPGLVAVDWPRTS